jgi:phosphoglycolate phosphatase-like HAD superfamily hydrolase
MSELFEDVLRAEGKPLPNSYRTIYIDFNGVLDLYDGWRGHHVDFPMRPGADAFLAALKAEGWTVVLFTACPLPEATAWMAAHGLDRYIDEITNLKGPAVVYLDDRGLTFTGDFNRALDQIRTFRVHWAREGQIA